MRSKYLIPLAILLFLAACKPLEAGLRSIYDDLEKRMKEFIFIMALCLLAGCQSDSVKDSIGRQLKEYPESRVLDIYKCFCQDNLGPGHLIPNKKTARQYLMWELSAYRQDLDSAKYTKPALRYFPVGDEGNYVRVDLSVILDSMINNESYLDAFVRSANEGVRRSPEKWKRKWAEIASCIREYFPDIPDATHDLAFIDSIMAGDDLIIHHSDAFGNAYHPHYRIISKSIFESEILPLIQNKNKESVK